MEEDFREAVCVGNIAAVKQYIKAGVDVNSQNPVNKWTALHWAFKRNHEDIIQLLVNAGARNNLKNKDGLTPYEMSATGTNQCRVDPHKDEETFVPNYLKNPIFPYGNWQPKIENQLQTSNNTTENHLEATKVPLKKNNQFLFQPQSFYCVDKSELSPCGVCVSPDELVLRVQKVDDRFCIEIALDRSNVPSYEEFVSLLSEELQLCSKAIITSVVKLPDILIRSKSDIRRLTDYQKVEVHISEAKKT